MILLAASILDNAVSNEQEAAQRARFRDVMIGCVRLVSRLPDEEWRRSVKEVISLANRASTPPHEAGAPDEDVDEAWPQATTKYEEVMDRVAEPLQKFYTLALNGGVRP